MFEKEPVGFSGAGAQAALGVARVIHLALMAGVVLLTAVAASGVVGRGSNAPAGAPVAGPSFRAAMSIAAVILPVVILTVALKMRRSLMSKADDAEQPLQARTSAVVVSGALVEALGILGAMMWMITGRAMPGAIVVGFALIGMAALFPKRREFEAPEHAPSTDAGGARFERPEKWS